AAAVEVVRADHVVAGGEHVEDAVVGGEAGGEGGAVPAPLEGGDAVLQGVARRIVRAAVLEALVFTGAALYVRRRLVDGRHDRTGGGIRFLPGVDRQRVEAVLLAVALVSHSS